MALHAPIRLRDVSMVQQMIQNGCDMNEQTIDGELTPLHAAILNSSMECFHLLLDSGANPLLKDNYGSTVLHIAAAEGAMEECKKLLAHPHAKILVTEPDNHGDSPLHYAASRAQIDAIQLLIDSGCDVNAKNVKNATPLHYAAKVNELKAVKTLIFNGAAINFVDDTGRTFLDYMRNAEHVRMAQEWIEEFNSLEIKEPE